MLLLRFMRGATIELLGVAAFLFVLSLARPQAFSDLAAAISNVAPRTTAAANVSVAGSGSPLLSLGDWGWNDDETERSNYVARQLDSAGDSLVTHVADYLSHTWRDLADDLR